MLTADIFYSEITKRFGTVKRSRDCFFYTQKGIRLVDLYQEGGRAILGWGGGSAFTVLKNVLNRGLTGSFDTDFTPRIKKAVSMLLASEREVFIFADKKDAESASKTLGFESFATWKPWSADCSDWSSVGCVLVEPPLAWTADVWLLAVSADSKLLENATRLAQARIPAPIAAATTRSIYDMIAALQTRQEKDWFVYDTVVTKYWTRKGPYLYPKISRKEYDGFVLHCIDCNLVISPDYDTPSIVPFGADKGVFTLLKRNEYGAK